MAAVVLSATASIALAQNLKSCTYLDPSSDSAMAIYKMNYWRDGVHESCFDFGALQAHGSDAAVDFSYVVFPVYPNGTSAGGPAFQTSPCDGDAYTGLWGKMEVVVDSSSPLNSIQSFDRADLEAASQLDGLFIYALVPRGSVLVDDTDPAPPPQVGWFNGEKVYYFNFGRTETVQDADDAPSVQIGRMIDVVQYGEAVGDPILDMGGSKAFSGFYRRFADDIPDNENYKENSVRSPSQLDGASTRSASDDLALCPPTHALVRTPLASAAGTARPFLVDQYTAEASPDAPKGPLALARVAFGRVVDLCRRLVRRDGGFVYQQSKVLRRAKRKFDFA
ncbi:hypothetical protein HK405_015118, partial [Cladochytrium tenue]